MLQKFRKGLVKLLREVAKDVDITVGAGLDGGEIGTSFERIQVAFDANPADELLVFYDLGSAKMNLEMVMEISERSVHLYDTAFVESAYTAAALIQAGNSRRYFCTNIAFKNKMSVLF